jgi:2-hydroxy-3-oxopropionate reductase
VETLDAPVSGGPPGAAAGTLAIMVGGDEDVFEACLPILRTMGSAITHMGVLGAGQVTKACNQIVLAGYLMGISEGLVFGAKAGVDPARIREALLGGYAQGRMLDVHGERMVKHAFAPGFFVRLHNKDLHIVLEMARSLATPTPIAALAAQNFNALVAEGGGDLDNSSMVKIYEKLAQQELV